MAKSFSSDQVLEQGLFSGTRNFGPAGDKSEFDFSAVATERDEAPLADHRGEPRSSLRSIMAELERFFLSYRVWFNQKLPLPVITVQSPGRRADVLGWFTHKGWEQTETGNLLPEINICPEHLCGDLLEVGHTMIHEMVHYSNARIGIRDCNINQYHNGHFKQRAEEVGLDCGLVRQRRFGWGMTRLTLRAQERIEAIALDERSFSLFRKSLGLTGGGGQKRKLLKWMCRCENVPGVWRAAGWPLAAVCTVCRQVFQLAR